MILYAVRHGETEAGARGIILGQFDSPLSLKGREQVSSLTLSIPKAPIVGSSSLGRTIESAELIIKVRGWDIPILLFDEFRERGYGDFQGKHKYEIARKYPNVPYLDDAKLTPALVSGVEPYGDFTNRVLAGLCKLKSLGQKDILLTTHGGVIRLLYRSLKKTDAPEVKNGSVHIFQVPDE